MDPTDFTTPFLREIRDELRLTRVELAWRLEEMRDELTRARLELSSRIDDLPIARHLHARIENHQPF
jgi:hypothetical protein